MNKLGFTHVVFEQIYPRAEVSVPVAEAADWYNANGRGSHRVTKVHSGDPARYSWAKAWFFTAGGGLAKIGAGAYGDALVWKHPAASAI